MIKSAGIMNFHNPHGVQNLIYLTSDLITNFRLTPSLSCLPTVKV